MTSLYGLALGKVLYPAWEKLRGRPSFELLKYLERSERRSPDELAAVRSGFLRRLVRHAYRHTAHYRDAFDAIGVFPDDIRELSDITRLPLLPRAMAQQSIVERTATWPPVAVTKATSGSTGQPLEVRISHESRLWRDATRWRGYGWGGYRMGHKAMHLWGVPAVAPSRSQKLKLDLDRKLRRDVYVSCMVRSPDVLRGMVDTIHRERPDVMMGYAQALADLARFINEENLRDWDTIPVIYGAERLWATDRDDLTKAFGPAIFETYGCREFMLMGCECEAHDGLHESAENIVVEILVRDGDGDSLRPALPGERGEVAITDLHNLASPFIRYLTGDYAVERAYAPCSCGRSMRRFGPIDGRITETMRDGDGNPVEGILFNILFLNVGTWTTQFQVVQKLGGRLEIKVVPKTPGKLAPEADAMIREFVGKHMKGIAIEIQVVDAIPLTAAGKLKRVIVERPPASS